MDKKETLIEMIERIKNTSRQEVKLPFTVKPINEKIKEFMKRRSSKEENK